MADNDMTHETQLAENEIIYYAVELIRSELLDKKRITRDWELISCDDVLAVFSGELTEYEATLVAKKYNEIIQQMPESVEKAEAFVRMNLKDLKGLAPFNRIEPEPLVNVDDKER